MVARSFSPRAEDFSLSAEIRHFVTELPNAAEPQPNRNRISQEATEATEE